ncbi:MAG TPA: substrate-binding domain-containing protein [Coleofasciculaceae cyanobacterium]|jgi:molybdate transport system substrate-binding protein
MPREIRGKIEKFLLVYCLVGLIGSCAQVSDRHSDNTELTVSAAASMQDALTDIQTLYQQKYPQTKIIFNFGSSGSLQYQIEQGAPIDLFINLIDGSKTPP